MDYPPFYNNQFLHKSVAEEEIDNRTIVSEWPLRDARVTHEKFHKQSENQGSGLDNNDQHGGSSNQKDIVLQMSEDQDDSVLNDRKINLAAEMNRPNRLNHQLHDVAWFPLCFPFVFLCCLPAMLYMRKSDEKFAEGHLKTAGRYRIISTTLYAIGTSGLLAVIALTIFLVVYFLQ